MTVDWSSVNTALLVALAVVSIVRVLAVLRYGARYNLWLSFLIPHGAGTLAVVRILLSRVVPDEVSPVGWQAALVWGLWVAAQLSATVWVWAPRPATGSTQGTPRQGWGGSTGGR